MSAKDEYSKVRRNLLRQVRDMERRGYFFPAGDPVPKIPKKITEASVSRLEKIKEDLYNKARWKDPITGKETSGVRGQEKERERARRKAWQKRKKREGGGDDIPTYTMYERIRQELTTRKTAVYTRVNKKVMSVNFDDDVAECISVLNSEFAKDPGGYEEYLSVMEKEIMDALEKSEILADFESDISDITKNYQILLNLLSGKPEDAPGEPVNEDGPGELVTDNEGFVEYQGPELPFK